MSDQEPTQQLPADEAPEPGPGRPKRLLRSREDRMLAGVAGGLAEYFGVDPLIFRIGFGVSVLFGGLGALAYVLLALFVPSPEADGSAGEPPIQRSRWLAVAAGVGVLVFLASWGIFDGDPFWAGGGWFFGPLLLIAAVAALLYVLRRDRDPHEPRERRVGILAAILIAIAAAIGISALALAAAWAGATGNGEAVAAAIVAIGVLLVLAALRGGARWLIVPALALAVPLAAVAAANVSFDGGIGERKHEPVTAAGFPAGGYEHGIGQMLIDLRSIEWNAGRVVDLRVDQGIGHLVIAVPESVCVTGEVDVGAGATQVAGDESDGFGVEVRPEAGTTATPRLVLDAELDLGYLQVVNDDDADILRDDGAFHNDFDFDEDAMREAMTLACVPEPAGRERR